MMDVSPNDGNEGGGCGILTLSSFLFTHQKCHHAILGKYSVMFGHFGVLMGACWVTGG